MAKLKPRGKKEIRRKLKFIKSKYTKRGYIISNVYGDNEFDHEDIKEVFSDSDMNTFVKDEHVLGSERAVRTVKDKVRSLCHSVPYKRITKLMTIHVVLTAVKWSNAFPSKTGVSNTLSPETLLIRMALVVYTSCLCIQGKDYIVTSGPNFLPMKA